MSFPARFPGTCAECGGRIKVGQEIQGDGTFKRDNEYQHAVVSECTGLGDILAVTNPLCPNCFLYHPEGACDR